MGKKILIAFAAALAFVLLGTGVRAYAAEKVYVREIDYDALSMKVYKAGNSVVYYSIDKKSTWNELDGVVCEDSKTGELYIAMDISWASATADVKICFKGDINPEVTNITLPKQSSAFKAKFNKAYTDIDFTGEDGLDYFWWRKSSDYTWYKVPFDTKHADYKAFLTQLDALTFKGAKIFIKTGQIPGESEDNPGTRPSKEVAVSITKRAAAPKVKLNIKKMTLPTKTTMEYYDETEKIWLSCEKNMTLEQLAPAALYESGGTDTVIKLKVAATEKKSYSQTAIIKIPGQRPGPTIGTATTCDVVVGTDGDNTILNFRKATANNSYEYCIIKPDKEFDPVKTSWRTVKAAKKIKLAAKSFPEGSQIYVRLKGTSANDSKNIALVLPSAYTVY